MELQYINIKASTSLQYIDCFKFKNQRKQPLFHLLRTADIVEEFFLARNIL